MQVLNLSDTKNLYNGNDEILELYAGEKILYKKVKENEYLMTYGNIDKGSTSYFVKFLHPFTLNEVYYIPESNVFSIAYMGNDIFALTTTDSSYIYIYKLNRNTGRFGLITTIKEYKYGSFTYEIKLTDAIQIVFYYNNYLYCLVDDTSSGYFKIMKINYDTINFNIIEITEASKSSYKYPIYNGYKSDYEGSFQIIDNYFLISDKNSKFISTFKILEDGNIKRIGYAKVYSYDTVYLLKDGNFLITNYKVNSDSETIGLGLFKENFILVKEIYKDDFSGCSPYSKTCYFNNKYYIIRKGYIYEYDNNLKTIKKINDYNYNYCYSIQISKDGTIYILGGNGFNYLNTLNENFSYQFKDVYNSSYSSIEPIIL